jgi:hypothetical protein
LGWFVRQLEGSGVKGASYSSLRGYLDGSRSPSLEILEASAPILGVRTAWLVLGEGQPTEIQESVEKAGEDPDAIQTDDAVNLMDVVPELANLTDEARSLFVGVLARFADLLPEEDLESRADRAKLPQLLWDVVAYPSNKLLEGGPAGLLSIWQYSNHVIGVLHAILLLMPPVTAATETSRPKASRPARRRRKRKG